MRRHTSLITAWAICLVYLSVRSAGPWKQVLGWDVFGYYLYLPALFIHDDPGLEDRAWLDAVMDVYEPSTTLYQLVDGPNGSRVIKYSSGMAVAYAPFFFAAHKLAGPLGHPADGFSAPYRVGITLGCLLYVLLGIFLLRRLLLRFFGDGWTAALLVVIGLGTNLFQLVVWDGTLLTHPLLFTLYTALVLTTIDWHEHPRPGRALLLGGLCGLITLVRPSEAVCVLIPLLWGLGTADGRTRKWALLRANAVHLLLAAAAFAVAVSPQAFYWKSITGQWSFYSYVNPGEGFEFASPYTWQYLFSFRKGWLVYTPLMLLALCGIPLLWKRLPAAAWAVAVFLVVDLWVVSSWTCWWYAGGSFSARSMVPIYGLLAVPLGMLLQAIWKRPSRRLPAAGIIATLVLLNLFQTWQWTRGIISKERMTRAYYAATFGRMQVPAGAKDLLLVDRGTGGVERLTDEHRYKQHELFRDDFHDRPEGVLTLTADAPFSPGPDVPYAQLTAQDHAWVRATARLWVGDTITAPPIIVMAFHHEGAAYKYATGSWEIPAGTKHQWLTASMDYLTPEVRSKADNLKVYVWDQHGGEHRIDDLRVVVFERK